MEQIQTKQIQRKISYFLFINSKSGGQVGKQYLTIPSKKITFQLRATTIITVHLIDLHNEMQRKKGVEKITKLIKKNEESERNQIKVIICGGDGTVLWVVSLITDAGIDTDLVVFSIIPIGTGNDFSRCLGWGGSPISFSEGRIDKLKKRIIQWLEAKQEWYDIWDIKLDTYEDGTIIQIRSKVEVDTKTTTLQRGLCNYFGVGVDARIAYSVQKKRQKNKWFNLGLYACVGLCKLFQRIRPMHEAIDTFMQGQNAESPEEEYGTRNEKEISIDNESTRQIPFLGQNNGKRAYSIKEGYGNLLALNSVRYMAGLRNVWNTNKMAVHHHAQNSYHQQSYSDGKIQFLAFKNELRLGLQRFFNCGAKVAQGDGPFHMKFKRTLTDTPTFIHIDGEAMKIKQLKSVTIKKNESVKQGRIKVLVKNENF